MNQHSSIKFGKRKGFTLTEIVVSFSILLTLMVVIAQTTFWCFQERLSNDNRFLANQVAINILEEARVTDWEKLDSKWAQSVQNLTHHSALPFDSVIDVKVSPSKEFKLVKDIVVQIRWTSGRNIDPREINLSASFASRILKTEDAK